MRKHFLKMTAAASMLAAAMTGCSNNGAGSGASTSTPLTIEGGFSGVSLAAHNEDNGYYSPMAATDYTMICSMLVSPYTSGSSALDSNGAFSLSIEGASGKPIGCFLTKSGAIAAVIEFASTSGFSGASGGAAFNPDSGSTKLKFPTNLSVSNGVVSVSTSQITSEGGTGAVAGSWVDPTGTWSITGYCQNKYDETTKKFVSNCNGAMGGDDMPTSVYLKQISATKVGSSEKKYGLSVWESSTARQNCGNVEGVVNLSGWTADDGWNSAFTGTPNVDLTNSTNVNTLAAITKVQVWNGNALCGATGVTDGVTTCASATWNASTWGMQDASCKLYCVMSALNNGGKYVSWDNSVTCPLRYQMDWSKTNELSNHKDYNGGTAGALNGGTCPNKPSSLGGGCSISSDIVLSADRGPEKRFTFGELFITGNVGTVMTKEDIRTGTFFDQSSNTSITCRAQRVEKMTIVQVSSTKAEVSVDAQMINHTDATNLTKCNSNQDFQRWMNDGSNMTIKLTKTSN